MGKVVRMCELMTLKFRKQLCFILKMKSEGEKHGREDD
jgi:hypothetical protein